MREQGADERWVTVQELRDRSGLKRYQGNTVSNFFYPLWNPVRSGSSPTGFQGSNGRKGGIFPIPRNAGIL
jgi:hypothetical protein